MKEKMIKIEGMTLEIQKRYHEYAKHVLRDENIPFSEISIGDGDPDEYPEEMVLYEFAKELLAKEGRISTAMMQRELKIGYALSARVMDKLEDHKIVDEYNDKVGSLRPMAKDAKKIYEKDGNFLFCEAKAIVQMTGKCSCSMLQRRLKISYTKALKVVDRLEKEGIVGPLEGSKPRKVLKRK